MWPFGALARGTHLDGGAPGWCHGDPFVAIGADPRTHLVHGQLNLNPDGTIAVDGRSSRTNIAGVFAAGDVIDPTYKQAATAAGSGVVASLDAEHYLASLPKELVAQATRATEPATASVA